MHTIAMSFEDVIRRYPLQLSRKPEGTITGTLLLVFSFLDPRVCFFSSSSSVGREFSGPIAVDERDSLDRAFSESRIVPSLLLIQR